VGLKPQEMDSIARGLLSDVLSLSVCKAGQGVGNIDAANIGWGTLPAG